jgi:hypothetical protein
MPSAATQFPLDAVSPSRHPQDEFSTRPSDALQKYGFEAEQKPARVPSLHAALAAGALAICDALE